MATDGPATSTRGRERVEGRCLHSGEHGAVTLEAHAGPIALCAGEHEVPLAGLSVVRTDRGVAVQLGTGGPVVDLVEHLLAALGGLGVRSGVRLLVEGGEVPLLDGGATVHVAALRRLGARREAPRLRVTEPATLEHGRSRYRLAPADDTQLTVRTEFPQPIGKQTATWDGSVDRFVAEIAPARTFGFAREAEALRASGRARGVDPLAVMVLDNDGHVIEPGAPMGSNEIARHKLLDLVGDLYLHGGPPLGHVEAFRPGHSATHAILRDALDRGVLSPIT